MASRVIGRLPVVYYPQTGKLEVENAGEFVEKQIYQRLDELAHGQPLHITLTVEPVNKARSTAQNSLMWALLTIMADHYNGGRTGGVTPEDCYLEMLEKYGAKVDYLEVPAALWISCAAVTALSIWWRYWITTAARSSAHRAAPPLPPKK